MQEREQQQKGDKYFSFAEATKVARQLYDTTGIPHQVAIDPSFIPGGGAISFNPETNGFRIHPFNPDIRNQSSPLIINGITGQPEVETIVIPLPKEAQN